MTDKRSGEGLDGVQAAILGRGEELGDLEAQVLGCGDLGGGHGAGKDGQVDVDAVLHDVLVVTRGDDELGTGCAGLLDLLDGQDSAGANAHLGLGLGHSGDALGGAGGAEGDLGGLHASCHKGVGERSGVLDLVEHNDRHDAQGLKRGVELIEHDVPFDVWRAWARDCQMCWSGADFGLVIGGTAWGSSNSKTGCSTSHVGNARQNRNGTGGFARPEESGSGPQGYGIGKLRPAEWGTN